jgi:cytochrome oxidase assembly protein ShyY1
MTAAALPLLLGLGAWQLQRAEWKAGLLARLQAARALPPVDLAALPASPDFRRATGRCAGTALAVARVGAQSQTGTAGYAWRVQCPALGQQPAFEADLGWAGRPVGPARLALDALLQGTLRDLGADAAPRFRLVAAAPPPGLGLQPLRQPAVADVPDNHRLYAAQWFGFAAILLAVYLAFVARWRGPVEPAPPSR